MSTSSINFAKGRRGPLVFSWPAFGIATMFLLVISTAALAWWRLRSSEIELQSLIESASAATNLRERQAEERRTRPGQPAVSAREALAMTQAVHQLNLPWRDLFEAVEHATPDRIALLAMEPNASQRSLTILARTDSAEEMLRYVERLKKEKFFLAVTLMRHETVVEDGKTSLRFQALAYWQAAGGAEMAAR